MTPQRRNIIWINQMFGDTDDTPMLPPDNDDDGDDQPPVPDEPTSMPPTEPPAHDHAPNPLPPPTSLAKSTIFKVTFPLHSLVLAIAKQGGRGHT